jgi:hypothetical protein
MDTAAIPSASAKVIAVATMTSRLCVGAGPRLPRSGLAQIGCRLLGGSLTATL